jgi:hypothetical protein
LSSDQANIQNGKYIAGRGKERREGRWVQARASQIVIIHNGKAIFLMYVI